MTNDESCIRKSPFVIRHMNTLPLSRVLQKVMVNHKDVILAFK
jgi:hypothetical protein